MTAASAELVRSEVEARIMVVDDEPEIATFVADSLRESDPSWDVVAESDPHQALARLTEEHFDCLITDLVMPGLGGLTLAEEARSVNEDLALIAITGRANLDASVAALRLGFADFIQKPFDLEVVQQAVGRSLGLRRRGEEAERQVAELAQAKATLEINQAQLSQKLQIASQDLVLSTKRLVRQMEDVSLAADVAKSVMGVIELEELLGLCAELIGDRVSCRTSTVALYETQENAVGLMVRAHPDEDDPPALCWLRSPIRSGAMCRAAQSAKTVHVEDVAQSTLVHAQEKELWHEGRLLVVPILHPGGPLGVAVLHRPADAKDFSAHDVKSVTELTQVIGPAIRTAKAHHRQRCMMYASLESIADAVESRDAYLKGHAARVLAYAVPIGLAMELSQCHIGAMQIAARLHDIGRLIIPDSAVNHTGPLNEPQWEIVRHHPEAGAQFLKPLDFLGEVGEIIRAHHESYDGTGYPDFKAGEEIPLVARILAVADAFDSMTSPRPYRDALSIEDARDQIARLSGQQFDPQAAEALLNLPIETLREIQAGGR